MTGRTVPSIPALLYELSDQGGTVMDHTVCHFEIPAEEPKRAAEFYRRLFDWNIRAWDNPDNKAEIHMVKTVPTDETGRPARPGVNGMILKRQNPHHPF